MKIMHRRVFYLKQKLDNFHLLLESHATRNNVLRLLITRVYYRQCMESLSALSFVSYTFFGPGCGC